MLEEILKEQQGHIKPTIQALEDFKKSYLKLLSTWCDSDILDNTESLKLYPFQSSFDELEVCEWVNDTIEEIKSKSE